MMEKEMFKPSNYDAIAELISNKKGDTSGCDLSMERLKMLPTNMEEKVIVVFIESKADSNAGEFVHKMNYQHFDEKSFAKAMQGNRKGVLAAKGDYHIIHDGREVTKAKREEANKQRDAAFKKASAKSAPKKSPAKTATKADAKAEDTGNKPA
jgi:hypothetical protein